MAFILDDIKITRELKWQVSRAKWIMGYKNRPLSNGLPPLWFAGSGGPFVCSFKARGSTHLEVKNAILTSVDKLDSLNGRVSTGGRINALKALTGSVSDPGNGDTPANTEESGGGCFIKTLGMP